MSGAEVGGDGGPLPPNPLRSAAEQERFKVGF